VIEYISQLAQKCIVCGKGNCDGLKCLPSYQQRCFKCLQLPYHQNFHRGANCAANNINTQRNSCPYCYISLADPLSEWTRITDHGPGKCLFRERIKRVLLYDVCDSRDKGQSARDLLEPCLVNSKRWFEVMYQNINRLKET